jgi:putative transcriptional regulator
LNAVPAFESYPLERQHIVSKTTTTEQTRRSGQPIDESQHGMTPERWSRLRVKTNEQVLAKARADSDALPVEDRKVKGLGPVGRVSSIKRTRWKLGLSQTEFAKAFGIPVGTLRDWEQHRRAPDLAARSYLQVIANEPEAVRRALSKSRPERAA